MLGIALTAAAYLVGGIVFYLFSLKRGFNARDTRMIMFCALLGGLLGAKVVRLTIAVVAGENPVMLLMHPDGRTIIGGVIAGWLAVELCKKKFHIQRSSGDGFAFALSIGEAIGRIGCFFSGCCYGAVSSVPWAVYQAGALRHPSQLYSAAVSLSIFAVLLYAQGKVKYEGDLFRIYLLLFGLTRFVLEFFRERSAVFLGLSLAQWISLELAGSMVVALAVLYLRPRPAASEPQEAS